MTLEFIVYCLLLVVVWLGMVPLVTNDNVKVPMGNFWKCLVVLFGFWLLQEVFQEVFDSISANGWHVSHSWYGWPNHPWSGPLGSRDYSFIVVSVLLAGLAIWLIGRLRQFQLLYVTSYGWAVIAGITVLVLSHLIKRFALPFLMPHIYHCLHVLG
jgi:hypothetical protein